MQMGGLVVEKGCGVMTKERCGPKPRSHHGNQYPRHLCAQVLESDPGCRSGFVLLTSYFVSVSFLPYLSDLLIGLL